MSLRVVALIAVYNEERTIDQCLSHLIEQGLEVYLIDNDSTDRTMIIAERYRARGLIGIERLPRNGVFSLRQQLALKERLAASLQADWFLHADADEIHVPPRSGHTLREALAEVDAQGYNAVNFLEFTFVPTRESPDHDHPRFHATMRRYYPFLPFFPHRLNAWRRQPEPIDLAWSAGHRVRFPGLRMYPESFKMRHYLFLSVPHAIRKFVEQRFDPEEVRDGWFGWRARLDPRRIWLPEAHELRLYESDDTLDPTNPLAKHPVASAAGPVGWAAVR